MLAFDNTKEHNEATYLYGMKVDNTPDPQQIAVYTWQWEIAREDELSEDLDFKEIVDLTKNVCALYNIRLPIIHTGLLPVPAYDEEGGHTLYFPSNQNSLMVVVHELAHVVCVDRYGTNVEGHGAEYVRCFIELLAYLRNEPDNKIIDSARKCGLALHSTT
jgi:hypothetical protein